MAFDRAAGAAVEALESRVLFAGITATLGLPVPTNITTLNQTENVVVTFVDSDPAGLPISGFAAANISAVTPVGGPTTAIDPVVSVNQPANSPTAVATYVVTPSGAGSTFTAADNATYTIELHAGVTDRDGNTPDFDATFGTFVVAIPPTATVVAPDITTALPTTTQIVVTYTSPGGEINPTTLGVNNITVTGPGSLGAKANLTVASFSDTIGPNDAVVTYTVDSPTHGPFSAVDDGSYTVGIAGNVTDTTGVPIVAVPDAGNFNVNIINTPTAAFTQPPNILTAGGHSIALVVTYTDPGAPAVLIDGTTINTDDITVTSPNVTPITITAISPAAPVANGSPLVVTYTASLPTGVTWSNTLNGVYTVGLTNTVVATNAAAITPIADFGTFTVALPDSIHPTATVNSPPLLQSLGATTAALVVTYTDNVGVSTASVLAAGDSAITFQNNATGETLDVIGTPTFNTGSLVNPPTLAVTYTLAQPDGNAFSAADNGSYTVAIAGSPAITDASGNAILPNVGVGRVVIDIGDTVRPTGSFQPDPLPDVTTSGISGESITVVLTAPSNNNVSGSSNIDVSTINLNSLSAIGSNGVALKPVSLSLSTQVNAQTVTAIYVVAAPNGTFKGVDNGTYTITLNGVTNAAGLAVLPSSVTTTFNVDVATPQNRQFAGQFGVFNGKPHTLRFFDVPVGTYVTVSARGGQGGLIQESDGSITLDLTDFGGGLSVTVGTNNNRPVTLDGVVVHGSLAKFQAPTSNLAGTFQVSGSIGSMTVRQIVGALNPSFNTLGTPNAQATNDAPASAAQVSTTGTLVATGSILNLRVLKAVTDAQILSGVSFGSDGIFGNNPNTLVDDDTYGPGFIGSIVVKGSFTQSVIGAGTAPGADGIFGYNPLTLTDDDVRAGTATSMIQSLTAATSDMVTRFEAGQFGTFKFVGKKPQLLNPALDGRFKGL